MRIHQAYNINCSSHSHSSCHPPTLLRLLVIAIYLLRYDLALVLRSLIRPEPIRGKNMQKTKMQNQANYVVANGNVKRRKGQTVSGRAATSSRETWLSDNDHLLDS